jgi:hypothetical protein
MIAAAELVLFDFNLESDFLTFLVLAVARSF